MSKDINIISWNVNGLRSILKKNNIFDNKSGIFEDLVSKYDIICLSETRLHVDDVRTGDPLGSFLSNYKFRHYTDSGKSGYAGLVIYSKIEPIKYHSFQFGRYLELEFEKVFFILVYVPNSGTLLDYRLETWDPFLYNRIKELMSLKDVIICGDFNVIHQNNDIRHYVLKRNKVAGALDVERASYFKLLSLGLYNVFRLKYPHKIIYTYYSYRTFGRKYNSGMLIDHFLVTRNVLKNVKDISILENIYGSDHLPITMTIKKSLFI